MSIAQHMPDIGDMVQTSIAGQPASAMVLSVSPDGKTVEANVYKPGGSIAQRTLTRTAGSPGPGEWNWRGGQAVPLTGGWGPSTPQSTTSPSVQAPIVNLGASGGNRGVELFDRVLVTDLDGKQAAVMVNGLSQPGHPTSDVLLAHQAGLRWSFSRPMPFSASPRPGHWSWPEGQPPATQLQASPALAGATPEARIPKKGDRIRVVDNGQLLGATIGYVFHDSSPTSEVYAAVDSRFGEPEKRFHYADHPAEGRWNW
ncbi:hypothetical protein [Singulisphaera sp. PoT]|uniref:hypothetical protein n=1 Tax=Singulisphaera sp. PoT TaxID=3411797 RepID=UPI003BF48E9F